MNLRSKFIAFAGSALLLASSLTMGSAATSDTASVAITRGPSVTVSVTANDFTAMQYSLTTPTSHTGTMTLDLTDIRGTAEGWSVSISASDFTAAADMTSSGQAETFGILDVSSSPALNLVPQVPQVVTAPANGKYSGNTDTYPVAMPRTGGTAAPVWSAQPLEGAGVNQLALNGTLIVPAGTVVGTYTSTVQVSLNAAPGVDPIG